VELTSNSFLALLILLAVVVTGATIWLWPASGGNRLRTIVSRTVLLTSSQLSLALVLMVWANAYFFWYGTWGDLFGEQAKLPKATRLAHGQTIPGIPDPQSGIVTAQAPRAGFPPTKMAGGDVWSRKYAADPAKYGRLDNIRVPGAITGYDLQAYVLLPPEYFQPQYAHRRFPVAIMLTGYPGSTKSLVIRLGLPSWVSKLRAQLQPTIYVMMQPTVVPPRDTECTNVPGGPQAATYFAQDVPTTLSALYRTAPTKDGWGIMGDSTGGYCAAKLGMMYSDRFGSAVSMSGDFIALQDATTHDLYGGSKAVRQTNNLIWRLEHLPPPPLNLLITSSRNGEKSWPQAQQFIKLARPPLNLATSVLDTGGHNYSTWSRVFPTVLLWMSSHEKVD
jgi:enterochelin esterase-like enzyme